MRFSKLFSQLVKKSARLDFSFRHLLFAMLTIVMTTSVYGKPTTSPSRPIHVMTIFNHDPLLAWPPTTEASNRAKAIRSALVEHLNKSGRQVEVIEVDQPAGYEVDSEKFVRMGLAAYESLNHKEAARLFAKAIQSYESNQRHLIEPTKVAAVYLTLGKTRLEQEQIGEAERLFRHAFTLDPTLSINEEFEHPETVRSFKAARRSFLQRPPEMPRLTKHHQVPDDTITIYGRVLNSQLELWVHSRAGLRMEVEKLDATYSLALSRIATRLLDCIPGKLKGDPPETKTPLTLAAGLGTSTYIRSPVGYFLFQDIHVNLEHSVSSGIELWLNLKLSHSGTDDAEHLREKITAVTLTFGPRPNFDFGSWSTSLHLAPWISHRSAFSTTTNPACKYFSEDRPPPLALCNYATNVRKYAPDWTAGLSVGSQINFKVGKRLRLSTAINVESTVLDRVATYMQHLLGVRITLGYIF